MISGKSGIGLELLETNFFCSNQWNGKNIFSPLTEPHTAKLTFVGVLKNIRRKLTKGFSLRSKKWLSQKNSNNYPESFFSTSLKWVKSWGIDWWKQLFWSNQWNVTNIIENSLSPQNVPHTAKLSLSGVLKLFRQKLTKKLFFKIKKIDYLKEKLRKTHKLFFSTSSIRGKSVERFWFDGNNFFWSNQWNATNNNENGFPPQNEPHS